MRRMLAAPLEAAGRAAENPAFPEPIMMMEGCSSDEAIGVIFGAVMIQERKVYKLIKDLVDGIRCQVGSNEWIHATNLSRYK